MKKEINFEFEGNKYKIDVERNGDDLVITKEGKNYNVKILGGAKKAVRPRPAAVPAAAAAAPAPAAAPSFSAAGAGDVMAPMTGTLKDIKVKKGDQVKANQLVVIMEAMKMDLEVFAPCDGTVQEIYLASGASVKENQPILKLA